MVFWVPIAMAAASLAAKMNDQYQGRKRRNRLRSEIAQKGGLAGYAEDDGTQHMGQDPSLAKLRMSMGDPDNGGVSGYYSQLLSNYQGSHKDLKGQLDLAAPMIPGTLANTAGYEYAQDFQEPGRLPEANAMQGYGSQAGAMGRSGAMGQRKAAAGLASRGLGSSSAMASLASQAAQAQGANQSNLYSQLQQQAFQQRSQNAQTMSQWAQRAFDMQRDIANMSLGAMGGQRTQKQDNSQLYGQLAGAAGQAAAAYFSSGSAGDGHSAASAMDQESAGLEAYR